MGEQRGINNRWNWVVAGFEPLKPVEQRDAPALWRRYSMSISSLSELSKHAFNSKLIRLNDKVMLPKALSLLALARTADGTRVRYSRLYRTLAMKAPALRDLVGELEKGGVLKDVKS